LVTDHFDIVAVRVQYEGAAVVRVVVRPQAGGAIVAPACGQRGGMEGIHLLAVGRTESHVQRWLVGAATA